MTKFNKFLHDYIIQLSSDSIHKEEGSGLARILVSGLPYNLAKDFISELINFGGLKIHGRTIPIVTFDKSIDSWVKPESSLGGLCGKDHVLNLRNTSSINDIVIILSEGSSLDKSNTTSLSRIGIDENLNQEDWIEQDMVQILMEKSLNAVGFQRHNQQVYKTLPKIIKNYHSKNYHEGDHNDQWSLLKSISSEVESGSISQLRSLFGMINENDESIFEEVRCDKIFEKIADNFENQGINSSIKEWCEREFPDNIKTALTDFQSHFQKVCESISSFRSSPYFYYSRNQWSSDAESWWETLTVDVWTEILEDLEELEGACSITVQNSLFKSNKPCPIVLNEIEFKLTHEKGFSEGSEIEVLYKRGPYEPINTIEIPETVKEVFWNDTPRRHKSPAFYKYRIEGYRDTSQKVISLLNYEPGVVFDIVQTQKVTALKHKRDKRTDNITWVSSVVLSNSGTHELVFHYDESRLKLMNCNWVQKISGENRDKNLFVLDEKSKCAVSFEVADECTITLRFNNLDDDNETIIRLTISVNETEPVGAKSILDKLIIQNRSSKGIFEKVSVYSSWSLTHQLQKWILDSPNESYFPLLLGTDFQNNFQKPNLAGDALLSEGIVNIDCRPKQSNFNVPKDLLNTRSQIIDLLTSLGSDDLGQPALLEYIELCNGSTEKNLKSLIELYIDYYSDWVNKEPQIAFWFDVMAICDVQNGVLENEPFAILLNPLHPIRLGWLFQSQQVLVDALRKEIPCPAAGIIDPSSFPDSFSLPCYTSQGLYKNISFLSIGSDSTTWSLLWNGGKLNLLQKDSVSSIFNSNFGLQIEGLESGLSSSQVQHTLDDIYKIKSGQNTLNVEVHSESSETELFNKGISNWIDFNLGDDQVINGKKTIRDLWFSSGSRQLHIYDTRDKKFQPSAEELIDITNESGYNLQWYSKSFNTQNNYLDLTILSHLTNQSPTLIHAKTSSIIYNGGIVRERIRYSTLNRNDKLSFTESRVLSKRDFASSTNTFTTKFNSMIHLVENEVNLRNSGHLTSTPRLDFVYQKLQNSDYCAIASSVVDPSAFFDHEGKSFLWDYDLPNYAARNPSRGGFYLLARDTDIIKSSVKNSLKGIPGLGNVSNEIVSKILSEISGRGIPTLKTLASGGSSASGEIGMLIAMNLLQNFESDDEKFEFFPLRSDNSYNLLIPIDPFTNQITQLYTALSIDKSRPDLLSLSFCIGANDEISKILITPIEVKYRNTPMSRGMMKLAHGQCESFKLFYQKLLERSKESILWDITRSKLLSDMISFAFSTYGRRISDTQQTIDWAIIQSKIIASLNNHEQVQFNSNGRLIIVSSFKLSEFDKVMSSSEADTLKISFEDAKDLILKSKLDKFFKLGEVVGNWGLIYNCDDSSDITKSSLGQFEDSGKTEYNLNEERKSNLVKETDYTPSTKHSQETVVEQKLEKTADDVNNPGIKFVVGKQHGAMGEIPYSFHPSNTNLNQLNVGIVGDLGTGKTQLVKALLYSLSKFPDKNRGTSPKFLIMDTKRDYDGSGNKESDRNFIRDIGAKVVKPYKLPINLFDIRNSQDDHPALSKAQFFIDILKKIFGGIGPNQEDGILTSVIEAFEERGYQPYMEDYSEFKSPTLKDIFEVYKDSINGKKDAPYSLMHKLVLARFFEEDSTKTIDFKNFFNQTVVLSLGGTASNDRNLKMLMIMFMSMYREYMLGVKKHEFVSHGEIHLRKIDSYLLIDEANLIMEYQLPVLEDLLLKGREFGIGIILSSQYLSHFKKSGTNYIEPLLTWFVHKVPNVSVKELQALGLTNADEGTVERIKSLECHFCLYKGLDAPGVIIEGIPHFKLDRKT